MKFYILSHPNGSCSVFEKMSLTNNSFVCRCNNKDNAELICLILNADYCKQSFNVEDGCILVFNN